MHWVTLIQHFKSLVSGTEDRYALSSFVPDDEGWVTLEDLFASAEEEPQVAALRQLRFSAALLVDLGLLQRRESGGTVQYRATMKAYVKFARWPAIGPDVFAEDAGE